VLINGHLAMPEYLSEMFAKITWADRSNAATSAEIALRELWADSSAMLSLLDLVRESAELRSLCETDDDAHKIILYADRILGYSIRIHSFFLSRPQKPHNHRWPFTSLIVRGSYRHSLFFVAGEINDNSTNDQLCLAMTTRERVGDSYTLFPEQVHVVEAEKGCLSMVVRGPDTSDRLIVFDTSTGKPYWHYGSKSPLAKKNAYTRSMSVSDFDAAVVDIKNMLLERASQ
jgi:hypothetical protein